ncbi:MAG: RNA-binding protein [Deltaproteobacteria bacterium]|nr:RNA-binding protein [Deltaproteobacteria bacterium]MBW2252981.1 RNA-binding protein [Deltaproteobacteria bacterium]
MEQLVHHLVDPLVKHADEVNIRMVEGDAAYILEMTVHDEDRNVFTNNDGQVLHYVRTILSAAAGHKKATLDLLDSDALGAEE